MGFSNDMVVRAAIFALGLCGFAVARHIYMHKNNNKNPLICPVRFDCHAVVHSDYSKLFGVPVEILGMVYYATISLAYLIFIFGTESVPMVLISITMLASFAACIFSIYLIAVQIFILKKGCSWCVVSALISISIFILTIFI